MLESRVDSTRVDADDLVADLINAIDLGSNDSAESESYWSPI